MLEGKREVALVTGAASGVGRATAKALAAKRGAAVVMVDINSQGLEETAEAIRQAGGDCIAFTGDISKLEDMEAAVAAAEENYGGLDTVVACAAILRTGNIEGDLQDMWDSINVTLMGQYFTCRAAVPALRRRGGGAIAIIASNCGFLASNESAPYIIAKHGVIGLVRSMSFDYCRENIRVNAIAPSSINTPMYNQFRDEFPEVAEEMIKATPFGRISEPEEIANVALHLTSDEASFTNGMVYRCDAAEMLAYAAPEE